MIKKYSEWKLDVCPKCYSSYFIWTKDADGNCIACMGGCKKESPEPKTIIVVEK